MVMVTLSQVSVRKQGKQLVGPLDLELAETGITALVGANGSGKSTVLRLLHGLERARQGDVTWHRPVAALEQAFVFQTPVMLRRTVFENIALPLRLRGANLDAVEQVASRFELTGLLDHPAQNLSGGEKQRLAMARAMVIAPKLLFLDEPTANLDRGATRMIETAMTQAARDGTRVIFASHSIAQIKRVAHDVVFMEQGQAYGPFPRDVFLDNPPLEAITSWMAEV